MFIIMLIITSNNRARRLDEFFQKRNGSTRTGGVVSTKLERCSTLYRLVASVDLHNYRARFETAEFFEKKIIIPDFFTLFPTHFYPLIIKFLSTRCSSSSFSQGEKSGGRKNYKRRVLNGCCDDLGWTRRRILEHRIDLCVINNRNRFEEKKRLDIEVYLQNTRIIFQRQF